MKSVIEVYEEIAKNNPPWTVDEEKSAIKRLYNRKSNSKFINEALKHNLGLVFTLMKKYAFNKNNEDLFQSAVIGLTNALKTYDPKKGVKISTWVFEPIRWALLKHQTMYSKQGLIVDDIKSFNRKYDVHLSVVEMDNPSVDGSGESNRKVEDAISPETVAPDYINMCGIKTFSEEEFESDLKKSVNELILGDDVKILTDREKFIIGKLVSGMNQSEVSKELNLTKMRISQIVAKAFEKIRNSNSGKKLRMMVVG